MFNSLTFPQVAMELEKSESRTKTLAFASDLHPFPSQSSSRNILSAHARWSTSSLFRLLTELPCSWLCPSQSYS